jgi:hypothetical protein
MRMIEIKLMRPHPGGKGGKSIVGWKDRGQLFRSSQPGTSSL